MRKLTKNTNDLPTSENSSITSSLVFQLLSPRPAITSGGNMASACSSTSSAYKQTYNFNGQIWFVNVAEDSRQSATLISPVYVQDGDLTRVFNLPSNRATLTRIFAYHKNAASFE